MPNQTLTVPTGGRAGLALMMPVGAILLSIASLTVGASYAKSLFPLVGAQGTIALRVTFSTLVLGAIWRPWRRGLTARDAVSIALYGGVLGSMNLLFYMSIQTIPIGVAIAIEFVGPLTVAVVSSRRMMDFVWVAFAVVGLALLLPLRQASNGLDPVGLAYILCASVFWALYIVFGTRTRHLHGGQVVSLGMLVASLVVLPFGIARAGTALLAPMTLVFGLAVGIMTSAIPYSLEMVALQRLPRQTFGILMSLEPAAGALAALVILGERLSMVQWLAICSIIVASVGTTSTARRPADTLPCEV